MNRSTNYVLDMLQEEDDDDLDQINPIKDFGTLNLVAEFNSMEKFDAGASSARDQKSSGFLKI